MYKQISITIISVGLWQVLEKILKIHFSKHLLKKKKQTEVEK